MVFFSSSPHPHRLWGPPSLHPMGSSGSFFGGKAAVAWSLPLPSSADVNNAWNYEGRLRISWTHFITPSRNFLEVRWRSHSRSTSFGKRCTSYNAPPTSRKLAAGRWSIRNFLPQSSLFMVRKAQKSHGARSALYGGCSNGVPPIHFPKPDTEFNSYITPCDLWAFPPMKRELWGKKFRSDQRSAIRFREVSGTL
jgi:hypothetical protein